MNIPNALKQLFPTADPTRDWVVQDDGAGVGPYIAAWHLQATQPTPAQLLSASDAYDVVQALAAADALALRTQVVTIAQSSVGVVVNQLANVQVRALLAVLLRKGGALDKDLKVRPLNDWAD